MNPETEANFTNWQFGSFNPNEVPLFHVLGFHTEPCISRSKGYLKSDLKIKLQDKNTMYFLKIMQLHCKS